MGLASSRPARESVAGMGPGEPKTPPLDEMAPLATKRTKGRPRRPEPKVDTRNWNSGGGLPRRAATTSRTSIECCRCCCQSGSSLRLGPAYSAASNGSSAQLDEFYCFSGCCGQSAPASAAAAAATTTSEPNYQTFITGSIDSRLVKPLAYFEDEHKSKTGPDDVISERRKHTKSARNIIGWPPVNPSPTPTSAATTTTITKHQSKGERQGHRRAANELERCSCEPLNCCCCHLARSGEKLLQPPAPTRTNLCADSPPVCGVGNSPHSARGATLGSSDRTRPSSRPSTRASESTGCDQLAGRITIGTEQRVELGDHKRRDELERGSSHIDDFNSYKQEEEATNRVNSHLSWSELILKYGKMAARQQDEMRTVKETTATTTTTTTTSTMPISVVSGGEGAQQQQQPPPPPPPPRAPPATKPGLGPGQVLWLLLKTLFPILAAFKDYSLPQDLLDDLMAGSTVAILHIPQGMAYGLLSGVEPIYGLYVSFIPVAVMALMSKSRHVSYGTFAIISMLLLNTAGQARARIRAELMTGGGGGGGGGSLVITNNHRLGEPIQSQLAEVKSQQLVQQLTETDATGGQIGNLLVDSGQLDLIEQSLPSNIEILSCVCLLCGLMHITMAVLRLGVLSLMFSDQLVSSFTTAGAIHVATSQLAGLFDMQLAPVQGELFKCARIWWQFALALARGQFNQTTALISLASLTFLLAVKELLEPRLRRHFKKVSCLPSELVLMALLIVLSGHLRLATNFGVKIVGHVASGLPEPKVPNLDLVPYVWNDALVIALLTFTINLSIARTYAKKFRYELDPNQELFALGSANLVGSVLSCFPCASSLSRSSVQSSLNVRSQLSSIFSCCLVIAIVCYFAHILHDLPTSTLSCIIMVALKGILMQVSDLYDNWRLSKLDALVWMISFVSVLAFGVTVGLVIGISTSLFMIFFRLLTPNYSLLARLPGTEIYVDKDAFDNFEELDRVEIFRFNSALCYLNRTILKAKIERLLPGVYEPTGIRAIYSHYQLRRQQTPATKQTQFLLIDCSALSYCDYAGASTLIELIDELADKKVCVLLAACPLKLVQMIAKMQRGSDLLASNVYPTISDAVGQIEFIRAGRQEESKDCERPFWRLHGQSLTRRRQQPAETAAASDKTSKSETSAAIDMPRD